MKIEAVFRLRELFTTICSIQEHFKVCTYDAMTAWAYRLSIIVGGRGNFLLPIKYAKMVICLLDQCKSKYGPTVNGKI